MAKIIKFPTPKIKLTNEETVELEEIEEFHKNATSIRQLFICWNRIRKFKKKVKKRVKGTDK